MTPDAKDGTQVQYLVSGTTRNHSGIIYFPNLGAFTGDFLPAISAISGAPYERLRPSGPNEIQGEPGPGVRGPRQADRSRVKRAC